MQVIRAPLATGAIFILLVFASVAGLSTETEAQAQSARVHSTLRGLHVAGYQGWFACPNDGGGIGWGHWFRAGSDPRDPKSLAIDMWPDTSDLDEDELCPTAFHLPSGAPAYLFSNRNPKTVARHFRWMRDYGIDGAAMQRFASVLSHPAGRQHFDSVLRNARDAAEASRRGFFVLYDVSGLNGDAAQRLIQRDWPHLAGDLRLTDSPTYVYHRGRPLVAVWGFGFKNRDVSPEQAAAIIRYLKTGPVPATVMGGVPASWRNLAANGRWPDARPDPRWNEVYRSYDVVSPWSVGRFRDENGADEFARFRIAPDLAETRRLGIGYMPVLFPGFSWHNGPGRATHSPLDVIPRRCGAFYRRQVANAIRAGAEMLFTAMFDEVNEGTAMFKLAVDQAHQPVGVALVPLDAGGCRVASGDMYLRITGEAGRELRRGL